MKKFIHITLALILGLAPGGCMKSDDDCAHLYVVESVLDFTALGGEGTITVSSDRAIAAESNKDWCKVAVSGMVVNVTVESHVSLQNRTALVTITSGGESTQVPVTQSPSFFMIDPSALNAGHEGGDFEVTVTSLYPFTAESDDDWITVTVSDNVIHVAIAENPDEAERTGSVTVTSAGIRQEVAVTQEAKPFAPLAFSDLFGIWTLTYENSSHVSSTITITLADSGTANTYNVSGWPDLAGANLIMTFDPATAWLTFTMGQTLPSSGQYDYILAAIDLAKTYMTTVKTTSLTGYWNRDRVDQIYMFDDNGSWPGYHVDGIAYARYQNGTFTGNVYDVMVNLVMGRTVIP